MKVLYFTAEWCNPCKTLKPVAQQVSAETGVPIEFVDIDSQRELVQSMGISGVPTLIGISNNQVKFRHTGVTSKQALKNLFSQI